MTDPSVRVDAARAAARELCGLGLTAYVIENSARRDVVYLELSVEKAQELLALLRPDLPSGAGESGR